MNLHPDHLETEVTPEGVIFENEFCQFLRGNGYPVNDVIESHVVLSSDGEHAYLVQKIETLKLPSGHPNLDVVADKVFVPICSCPDWRFHKSPDVSEAEVQPHNGSNCKHISACYREQRAEEDDSQVELV